MAKQSSPRTTSTAPKKKRVSEAPQPTTGVIATAAIDGSPRHDDIAQRAFALYQARGASGGDPLQDWLTAERELFPAH